MLHGRSALIKALSAEGWVLGHDFAVLVVLHESSTALVIDQDGTIEVFGSDGSHWASLKACVPDDLVADVARRAAGES